MARGDIRNAAANLRTQENNDSSSAGAMYIGNGLRAAAIFGCGATSKRSDRTAPTFGGPYKAHPVNSAKRNLFRASLYRHNRGPDNN
jgi:hypothetical protein